MAAALFYSLGSHDAAYGQVTQCADGTCQRSAAEWKALLRQAEQLSAQSDELFRRQRYAEALPLAIRHLEIKSSLFGIGNADVLIDMHQVGILYQLVGNLDKAEELFKKVIDIWQKLPGVDVPNAHPFMSSLAGLYIEKEEFDKAALLYRQILKARGERGAVPLKLAVTLYGLGVALWSKRDYDEARLSLERALAIQREHLPGSLPMARTQHVLGHLYRDLGENALAEPMIRSAIKIRDAKLPADDMQRLASQRLLGLMLMDQGDFEKARSIFENALQIYRDKSGPRSKFTLLAMSDLALAYKSLSRHQEALPLFRDVARIREETLGADQLATASALANYADELREIGDYMNSEVSSLRALQIYEDKRETANPAVADILNNMGALYLEQGRYERALAVYKRALSIDRGLYHPGTIRAMINQALVDLARDHIMAGVEGLETAFMRSEYILRLAQLSESRLDALLELLQRDAETSYTLPSYSQNNQRAIRLALAMLLLRKGRSLDELARASAQRLSQPASIGAKSEASDVGRLRSLRSSMARRYLALQGQTLPAEQSQSLVKLEQQLEQLEQLDQKLAGIERPQTLRSGPQQPEDIIKSVRKGLMPGSVLIEIVWYQPYLFKNQGPANPWDEPRYQAFLLFAKEEEVRCIDLGPAEPINKAVAAFRQSMESSATAPADYIAAGRHLHSLVFAKLKPHLGTNKDLYLSLDGMLQEVPFAALHDGEFLLGRYHFFYLSSGLDLISEPVQPARVKARAMPLRTVVVADPDYDRAVAPAGQSRGLPEQTRAAPLHLLLKTLGARPGFKAEAEMLRRRWPGTTLFLRERATEQALFAVTAPPILHIATHGVFLADARIFLPRAGARPQQPDWSIVKDMLPRDESSVPGSSLALPLLCRSALMLAGVNGKQRSPLYDGLATALEVTSMNLHGTQLVVLSACDTGRGAVSRGQGVYGLRRAFRIAGAETLVTSLWRVNDSATADLMDKFYENLQHGQGRVEALEEAMKSVKGMKGEKSAREHPYYWAPFIAIGDPRPLRGL